MSHTFAHKSFVAALVWVIAFAQASPAYAADGSLDSTFGNGGIVITDFGGYEDFGMDLEVQPDGRIVLVGSSSDGLNPNFALARYNPDGSPDTTFGVDSKVSTDIAGGHDTAYAVALQPDGKIIAVGNASNGIDLDFALARYNPDGSLDTTFDLDGKVLSPISPYADYSTDVVLQPDGKILISGWSDGSEISPGS